MSEQAASIIADWRRKWQYLLDKSSPHPLYRWIGFSAVLAVYIVRIYLLEGFYIVTYGVGVFLLSQLIGFLTPQFVPESSEDDLGLPTRDTEEFRPFARRLPEFKFWTSCMKAVLIGLSMTFISLCDVPVAWQVLVVYFLVVFYVTMQRQITHMIKHKYVPWSYGKATYSSAGKLTKDGK